VTTAEQLSCQELVELVTDYLEGALTADERARFDDHIGICTGCGDYLEQMRRTVAALGRLPREAVTPEAEAALLSAFRGWKSR
jgi:anti-sigma factor RsiW